MKPGRTQLSFSVIGVAARETMLLKSFVRMLDSRTKQRWVYLAEQIGSEQQAADLTFLGDEGVPLDSDAAGTPNHRKLRLGALALDAFSTLDRPLRPDELARELNRLGKLLVTARMQSASSLNAAVNAGDYASAHQSESPAEAKPLYIWQLPEVGSSHSAPVPTNIHSVEFAGTVPAALLTTFAVQVAVPVPGPALAVTPEKVAQQPAPFIAAGSVAASSEQVMQVLAAVLPTDNFRLLRWPHASLVNTPARLKLAAFVSSGSHTLESLHRTSGQTAHACARFVQDLRASGFLSVKPHDPAAASSQLAQLQSPGRPNQPALTSRPDPSIAPRAQASATSLFARIRARLGISVAG